MRFTLNWLRKHLDTEASLDRISTTLSSIGLEVEGIEDRGATLAAFRIARVLEALPHPNADRLRACRIDMGDGRTLSVVCGAPNARTGMLGVVALPGAFIPGTGITLKAGEIRGVKSEAMLLSAREMALGDDHSGIVDLPGDAPIGESYVRWAGLDDPVIEIGVTPNRGDALAVRGIARDLAAAGLGTLRPFAPPSVPASFASPLRWKIENPASCTWVLGRAFRGLRNGPSPKWLQDRLVAVGLRPISTLVDITNWFTIDLGRPLHVFDTRRIVGDTLHWRMARNDEAMAALNGRDLVLDVEDGIVADQVGVQSLGGIVGGAATGCDADTTDAFLECALFDPVRIARSGRRHALHTDARQRFERGVDPALLPASVEAASAMILALCGGEASEVVVAGAEPAWRREATLRFDRLAGLGGDAVPAAEATRILRLLGFGFAAPAATATSITVEVPSWRNDIAASGPGLAVLDQHAALPRARAAAAAEGCAAIEAEADLVEEVLRIRGLDRIAAVSLPLVAVVPAPALTARQARTSLARRVLASRGLQDSVTYGFLDARRAAFFDTPDIDGAALVVDNPIAADLDRLRASPLPGLLAAASRNTARGFADLGLSEVAVGYRNATPSGQTEIAAALRTGGTARHWVEPSRAVDAFDAKGDALAVLEALGVPMASLSVTADPPDYYHPGRAGQIRQGPKLVLARFGELHPRVLAAFDLAGRTVACEVLLDAIADPKRKRRGPPDLPSFQPVRRDFAFLADAATGADVVLRAARGADRTLIAEVALFDRYEGESLPAGKVSLGIEVTLQPREATLTDAEIEAVSARVVAAVAKATGATLR